MEVIEALQIVLNTPSILLFDLMNGEKDDVNLRLAECSVLEKIQRIVIIAIALKS